MFDATQPISLTVRRTGQEPVSVKVRFPTDEEWCEWYRKREVLLSQEGRGSSTFDVDSKRASTALYEHIKVDGSPELHPLEAADVIDRIGRRDIRDVQSEADQLVIQMTAWGADVEHHMRLPGVREVSEFRRASSRVVTLPFGKQQVRQRLEPGMQLYDTCLVRTAGYANGSIPAIHKDEAIRSVLAFIENEADEGNG